MMRVYEEKLSGLTCRVYGCGTVIISDREGKLYCPSDFTPPTFGTVFGNREFVRAAVRGYSELSELTRLNWCETGR